MIGDVEEANIHFKGLSAMIECRKGIDGLGYSGLIARIVKWYRLTRPASLEWD
jgi:hypothetical protein